MIFGVTFFSYFTCLFFFDILVVWEDTFGYDYLSDQSTSCEGRCNHHDTRTCRCDHDCLTFGDCCFDYDVVCNAPSPIIQSKSWLDPKLFGCYQFVLHDILLVDKCSTSWKEPYVRTLCTTRDDSMFVFDQYGYNFRNIFCAVCNHRKISDLHPWHTVSFSSRFCATLSDGSKLLNLQNNKELDFITGSQLRFCYHDHQCPPSTDPVISKRCESIVFPACFDYKNPFCSLCLEPFAYKCHSGLQSMWQFRSIKPVETVVVKECLANELRDPVTQTCRQILCRPGYSLSLTSTECVPNDDMNLASNWKCSKQQFYIFFKSLDKENHVVRNCLKDYLHTYRYLVNNEYGNLEWNGFEMKNHQNSFKILRFLERKIQLEANLSKTDNNHTEIFCGVVEMEVIISCDFSLLLNEDDTNCMTGDWYTGTPSDFIIVNKEMDMKSLLYIPDDVYFTPTYIIYHQVLQVDDRFHIENKALFFICGEQMTSTSLDCDFVDFKHTSYSLIRNGTILVDSAKQLQSRKFLILFNGDAQVCFDSITDYLNESNVNLNTLLLTPLQIIGFAITPISLCGLLGTLATYVTFKQLRNAYGYAVMSFSFALFHAQLLTLLTDALALEDKTCVSFAVIKHYFWLATFTWTTNMAFYLYRQFGRGKIQKIKGTKVSLVPHVIGWVLPLVMVCAVLAWHLALVFSFDISIYGGETCWILRGFENLFAFGIPVVLLLSMNVILLVITLIKLRKARHKSNSLQNKAENSDSWREVVLFSKVCITRILDNPSLFHPVPESSRTIFPTQVNPSQDNPSLSFCIFIINNLFYLPRRGSNPQPLYHEPLSIPLHQRFSPQSTSQMFYK